MVSSMIIVISFSPHPPLGVVVVVLMVLLVAPVAPAVALAAIRSQDWGLSGHISHSSNAIIRGAFVELIDHS